MKRNTESFWRLSKGLLQPILHQRPKSQTKTNLYSVLYVMAMLRLQEILNTTPTEAVSMALKTILKNITAILTISFFIHSLEFSYVRNLCKIK